MSRTSKKRVTLKQVADHAGVSLTTASLALNGNPSIPDVTCQKVFKAIEELGYIYDRAAANLRSGAPGSGAIGIIVTDLVNPFYTELLIGIQQKLNEMGQTSLLGTTFDSCDVQDRLIAMMLEYRVSGLLLFAAPGTQSDVIRRIRHFGVPVVLVNRHFPELPCDYIGADNAAGGKLATTHLISQGCRRIAFLGGNHQLYSWHGRLEGYRRALAEAGLKEEPGFVAESLCNREEGAELIDHVLSLPVKPDGIFCYNDTIAIGAMMALKAKGLTPGRDVAVAGFDDIPEGLSFSPSLTTVTAHPRLQGALAVALLQSRMADPSLPVQEVVLPVELIQRASSTLEKRQLL